MKIPEHEMAIRRELGEAMMKFVEKLTAAQLGNDEEDSVMRQVATEEYRRAVEKAARQNIEVSVAWHTKRRRRMSTISSICSPAMPAASWPSITGPSRSMARRSSGEPLRTRCISAPPMASTWGVARTAGVLARSPGSWASMCAEAL